MILGANAGRRNRRAGIKLSRRTPFAARGESRPGRYGRNVIALAVGKGEAGWLAHVSGFASAARADGTVVRAIESAGLKGVEVEGQNG